MRYFNATQKVAEPLIKKSGVLALDTETKGLLRRSKIVMLIVCTPKDSFIWDTRKEWPTWLNPYLADERIPKIIHNGLFDGTLTQTQQKVRIRNIEDTMLQEKILLGTEAPFNNKDERVKLKYSTSLKYSLIRHKLPAKKDFDSRIFATWPDDKPFIKDMLDYGYGDVEQLFKLNERQRVLGEKMNLMNVFWLENNALQVFIQMRTTGINFNKPLWLDIADGYSDEYKEKLRLFTRMLKTEARQYNKQKHYIYSKEPVRDYVDYDGFSGKSVGTKYKTVKTPDNRKMPEEINPNSPKQVKELFALRGILIESYTDFKRQYSMNKVAYDDKLLDLFFEMRNFYQLSNTFGAKWLHEDTDNPTVDAYDGRVHPDFTQIISTGRSSCSNPNLQQLPAYKAKELKGGHPREAFIATKGWTMFSPDYKAQEFALMMILAKEPKWLEYIRKGYDTHSMITKMAQPKKWADATEPGCLFEKSLLQCKCAEHGQLRTYTKKIIFGMPYGKGITSVAEDLNVTYEVAAPIVKAIKRVMPKLLRWMEKAKADALRHKAVWTLPPFSRYRKLEFFVAPKSRFSEKKKTTLQLADTEVEEETEESVKTTRDYFKTKGASKDSWRRKMIADNTDWRVKNQGVNSPIQGSGADMLKLAMVYLQKVIDETSDLDSWGIPRKLWARILLPIHDALLSECIDTKAVLWENVIKREMEKAAAEITNGQYIIKVDIKKGKSWI